ncbi:MAG: DUF1501 domain-containing protein [Planctomycetaceae bacterium]
MLSIGSAAETRDCAGIRRRDVLRIGSLSLGGLTLADLLAARAAAKENPLRDKSIVLLFLTGGPSQIETFDPKGSAPAEFRSVTGEIATALPGVTFGGTFTGLAERADRLAVVRSFTHDIADHTLAVEQVIRGGNPIHKAGMGSVAARLRALVRPTAGIPWQIYSGAAEVDRQFDKERLRLLAAAGPGELGGGYAPFAIGGDAELQSDMELNVPRGRLDDRRGLQLALDRQRAALEGDGGPRGGGSFDAQALDLLLGQAKTAFDLSDEDPRLIARYDTSRFLTGIWTDRPSTLGHQLLLARRLCEAGCGFVTIHNAGWDMHGGPTQMNMPVGMRRLGTPVDVAVSTFLDDVSERGLSERILFILTGEFGRSPRVHEHGGRDHWPRLSTLAFAGGGLPMGQVIGRSTSKAEEPHGDPVTPENLLGTVLHTLFDVSALRARPDLPRDLLSLIDRSPPIRELV